MLYDMKEPTSTSIQTEPERARFDVDASRVLGALRTSIANVIATAGGVRKPADLQKSFKLDWTLSWQLFQVAGTRGGGNDGGAVARGANVPSRTSLKKFLEAARSHGIEAAKVERVWADYEQFERLVDVHAGDRTSFNSMVSAVASIDEEWIATNAQHLRNAYRAMSHVTGMQAKAKMSCGILQTTPDATGWDIATIVGYVGLRTLRAVKTVQVFRNRLVPKQIRGRIRREPLALNAAGNGFLLEAFASKPLNHFKMSELDDGWLVGELNRPEIGNLGASTMHFGTVYRDYPVPGLNNDDHIYTTDVTVDKPVEVMINDMIVQPGIMKDVKPSAEMFLGHNKSDSAALPGDLVAMMGDYKVDFLGLGSDVLATPDVPQYPEMVGTAAAKLGWDISRHEVWRIRTEFPAYLSTVRMKWELP